MSTPDVTAAMPPFSGSPTRYRRIALALGLGTHAYLYAGMVAIEYGWRGETWIIGWKAIAATLLSAGLVSRFAYSSIMQLDARYGSGSRWKLDKRQVKLPVPRQN